MFLTIRLGKLGRIFTLTPGRSDMSKHYFQKQPGFGPVMYERCYSPDKKNRPEHV